MNKLLFLAFLYCASAALLPTTTNYNFSAAYENVKNSYNDAVKTVVSNEGQLDQNEINAVVNNTVTITATKLTEALKELQTQADTKLEEAHLVLNISVEQEKQIIQTGFALIEAIISHLNEYAELNITTEDEAVEITNYVNEQISQAESLLKNIRQYITTFVNNADEQIRSMTNKAENTVTTILTSGTEIAKHIDEATKQINAFKQLDTPPPALPEHIREVNITERKLTTHVLDAVEAAKLTVGTAGNAVHALANATAAISNTLPEGKAKEKIAKITNDFINMSINMPPRFKMLLMPPVM